MLIECEKCHTKYEVPDSAFEEKGRKVKCDNCGHVWFQKSLKEMVYDEISETIGGDNSQTISFETEEEAVEVEVEQEVEQSVSHDNDISMREVLEKIGEELSDDDLNLTKVSNELSKEAVTNEGGKEISDPSSVKSFFALVAMRAKMLRETFNNYAHMVINGCKTFSTKGLIETIKANFAKYISTIFTATSFLTLTVITLAMLYSGREYVVNTIPATYIMYEKLGAKVDVPGEGLEISGFTAQYFNHNGVNSLKIEAEIINRTEEDRKFPNLEVSLKDETGAITKVLSPEVDVSKRIKGSKSYPFTLEFNNVPDNSTVAEIIAVK